MSFVSAAYPVFFVLVALATYATPPRRRWAVLLAASYTFYARWRLPYLALLVGSTLLDYWAARRMQAAPSPAARRPFLAASLAGNLGLLFTFKYADFVARSLASLGSLAGASLDPPLLGWVLPVGISFYTFQSLGYSLDVYRGRRDAEPHLGRFALYVAFFPQLVAGPIERSSDLLPQLEGGRRFDPDRVARGLRQVLWGLFKKLAVADVVAPLVGLLFARADAASGSEVLLAGYLFGFQIYGDFSGYSDIAIGSARALGYDLSCNFERPYLSASLGEFWRRWHVTLSTWFRDYLYVPLGGSRGGPGLRRRNLLLVFLVSGLWHGAAWTFVAWGLWHGALRLAEVETEGLRAAGASRLGAAADQLLGTEGRSRRLAAWVGHAFQVALVFHLVALGWVLFRAESLGQAWALLRRLPRGWAGPPRVLTVGAQPYDLLVAAAGIGLLVACELRGSDAERAARLEAGPAWRRWAWDYLLVAWILVFGPFAGSPFVYFQF